MKRFFFVLLLLLLVAPAYAVQGITPEAYSATYKVKYRGFTAGTLHFTLQPLADNTYLYETRVKPGFLASFVISKDATERSIMQIDEHGVRPLSWVSEDGTSKTIDDGSLIFDWSAQQVSGTVEDKAVNLSVEPGLQDRLSMQVAVLTSLLRDSPLTSITMIDEDRIKQYSYKRKGMQQVDAAGRSYETLLYESSREGSSRLKRIYHAPKLDYIPVRFEHLKKGKLETVLELVSVSQLKQ